MKKLLLTAITTVALLPLCTTAQADAHSSETSTSGMYIGASYGKGEHDLTFNNPAATEPYFDGDVTTMSAFVGMDLNETFALEGFYTNLGESQIFVDAANNAKIKVTTMGIAIKAGANLTNDIRGYVKAGYHSWKSKANNLDTGVATTEKEDGTDVLYGIGVEYKLSDSTAIIAAYDRYTVDDSNGTDMSIGIKYRF